MIKLKIRYAVCLILAFMLVLPQTIGMAEADLSDGSDLFRRNLQFESTLGLLSGFENKNADDPVLRSEMTALLVRALNLPIVKNENVFPDVSAKTLYADEIQTAYSAGIVVGNSDGNFCPDENVLYYHAVKIAVDAMGCRKLAELSGGYTKGYLNIARKLDILKNVRAESDGTLTWQNAVNLTANILTADKPLEESFSADGGTFKKQSGRTVLTENFGFTKITGVIGTGGIFSLESDFKYEKDTIVVGDLRLDCNFDNPEQYLGLLADVWYDKDENAECILVSAKNEIVNINAENLESYDNYTLTVYDKRSEKKTSYSIDKGFTYVLNGRLAAADDMSFVYPDGSMTLVDNNGDGKYDCVMAQKAQYMIIGSIDTNKGVLYDKNGADDFRSGAVLSREKGKWYRIISGGEEIKLNSLSAGDILELYISGDELLVCAEVLSSAAAGTFDGYTDDAITVGGTDYYKTKYFENYVTVPKIGTECIITVDGNGKIVYCTAKNSDSMSYGYLVRASRENGISDKLSVKILTEKNTFDIYTVSDKVMLNGEKNVKNTDKRIDEALFLNGNTKYQLLRFGLNKDGELSKIDTYVDAPTGISESGAEYTLNEWLDPDKDENDKLTRYVDRKIVWYRGSGQASPYFTIGQTIAFAVPEALVQSDGMTERYDDECFEVTSIDWDNDTRDTYVDAYDYNSALEPGAVVVYTMASGGQQKKPLTDSSSYIVEKVRDAADENGAQTKSIRLYNGTEFSELLVDSEILENVTIPSSGDIIRIRRSADGKIRGITIDCEFISDTKTIEASADVSTNLMAQVTYISGTAFAHSKNSLAVYSSAPPTVSVIEAPANNIYAYKISDSIPVIIYNYDEKRAKPGTVNDIVDSYYADGSGSKIVLRSRSGDVKNIFLFVGD